MMTSKDKPQKPLLSKEAQKELDRLSKRLRKDRKKAEQPLIVVGISAAMVGVIALIYICFRFNWPLWRLISLILIGIVLLILLIREGYTAQWTGFKSRTLWDWLQLLSVLAIPIVVALATLLFGIQQANLAQQQHVNDQKLANQQHDNDQRIANQQHQADQQRALDQQQATILQTYIDNIQDLLLNHNLLKSKPGDDVATLARARTLTALQGLDPKRKGLLVQFIYEARLIGFQNNNGTTYNPVVDLSHADLSHADLYGADLSGADLSRTDLQDVSLNYANLNYANLCCFADLTGAWLYGADLGHANLSYAELAYAELDYAHLGGANLRGADLGHASLSHAELAYAHLNDAHLFQAYFSYADLSHVDLSHAELDNTYLLHVRLGGANFSHAEFYGVFLDDSDLSRVSNLTQQQLDQVNSCKNVSHLPPGLTCHYNQ